MATENPFVKLFAIDFKDHLEVKKSGNTELKYVSWAYAWAEVKKLYPAASYEVKKFNGLPYVYDPITGFMVYTTVTIEGVSHEMWLPVLDSANKAMKATPYTYNTPKWDYNPQTRRREKIGMEERTVEAASIPDSSHCTGSLYGNFHPSARMEQAVSDSERGRYCGVRFRLPNVQKRRRGIFIV